MGQCIRQQPALEADRNLRPQAVGRHRDLCRSFRRPPPLPPLPLPRLPTTPPLLRRAIPSTLLTQTPKAPPPRRHPANLQRDPRHLAAVQARPQGYIRQQAVQSAASAAAAGVIELG